MKPAPFDYQVPATLDEAVAAMAGRDDVKVLAGGQSLIPLLALRLAKFDQLVDLRKVEELKGIRVDADAAYIGAMTPQGTAEKHAGLRHSVPLIPRALERVGHFQIRNRGTVGGSIAHADSAAELPAVALALAATMDVVGPRGRRSIDAKDFFVSTFMTALEDDEILAGVTFPVWGPHSGFAVEEVARRSGDFALVGAVCGIQLDGSSVSRAAIGMFGLGSTPLRADAAEAQLLGASAASVDPEAIGAMALRNLDPPSDIHATAEYRRAVGAHVVGRAIARSIEEAQNG